MNTSRDLAELRERIATGSYIVDADRVAGTIVRKLAEVERVRRSLTERRDDRSHEPGE
jgi:hypothetical protein